MTKRQSMLDAGLLCIMVIALAVVFHVRHFWSPLTLDEIVRLGALRAIYDKCNIPTETTWKADELNGRAAAVWDTRPTQQAAIAKATESFKDRSCDNLLTQFPDMIRRVED